MARVRQIDSKTWEVTGATADEVSAATKAASRDRTPIDHGHFPGPMKTMMKVAVGLVTHDTYDADNRGGAKTHFMGPGMYRTRVEITEKANNVVEVRRKTQGMLAPFAEVGTNLGAAIEEELNK